MKFSALLANTALTTLAVFVALAAAITEDEFTKKADIIFKSSEYLVYKELCGVPLAATTYDDKQVVNAICNNNANLIYNLVECQICLSSLHAETL